jgi:hypothetical protein
VRPVGLSGGVDGHDVGVVQPGRGLRLPAEPGDGRAGEANRAAEDLHGDPAAERDLAGFEDDAHAAAAELAAELKVVEPSPGRLTVGRGRAGQGLAEEPDAGQCPRQPVARLIRRLGPFGRSGVGTARERLVADGQDGAELLVPCIPVRGNGACRDGIR